MTLHDRHRDLATAAEVAPDPDERFSLRSVRERSLDDSLVRDVS